MVTVNNSFCIKRNSRITDYERSSCEAVNGADEGMNNEEASL